MFKKVLVSFIAFSSLAFADASQVYGNWVTQQEQNGFRFTMKLSVAQSQTAFGAKCEFQGQTLEVGVSVPSEVTDTQLVVKGSAHQEKNIGNFNCNVGIQPMAMDYQVSGNTLTLTANGESLVMTRAN